MLKRLKLVNILLILLLFPASSLLVKDYLVYRYTGADIKASKVLGGQTPENRDIMHYAVVVESPVFPSQTRRFTPAAAAARAGNDAVISAPPGDIALVGTYVGKTGFAIFANKKDGTQEVFRTGDNVFNAGVLSRILGDRAYLSAGAREIEFRIPVEEIPTPAPVSLGGSSRIQSPASRPSSPVSYSRQTGTNEWVIDQGAVLSALEDIGSVLSDARLTPVVSGGNVEGFLVTEIKPRGIFDAIGLKNGDKLMRVNGYEMTSPERAVQVLTALKGETRIDIDIERGGEKKSLHYTIR